jgi:hypothetical protein
MSHEREPTVNVTRQLRPIRLAFLVSPGDGATLRRVVEINSCLWGGIQNPIVPVFLRRPANRGDRWDWPGAAAYAQGLLNAFEPDFVVETKQNLASGLAVPSKRLITIADVLDPSRDPNIGYGVSVIDVLRNAYDEEFKFVWRQKLKALWPRRDAPTPSLFETVMFGDYPRDEALRYLAKAFSNVFEPDVLPNEARVAFDALIARTITPLRAGQYGLDERPGGGWRSRDPVLFLLDRDSVSDLIDFWNLRAWGGRILPLPLRDAKHLVEPAIDVIKRANVRLRGNPDPNMKHRTTLLKARSVSRDDVQTVLALLKPIPEHSLVVQEWMPRTWSPKSRAYDLDDRTELMAAHDDLDVSVADRHIRFDLLEPSFEVYSGWAGLPRWANSITVRDFSGSETGLVHPVEGKELGTLLRAFDHGGLQALRSGIAVISTGGYSTQHWELPDGEAVVRDWFAAAKVDFKPSAAGRTAVEICRATEGLHGLSTVANVATLKWLNDASGGKSILQHELLGLLKRERPMAADNLMRALVRKGILRLGLRIICSLCETEGWFGLDEMAESLRCARCLRTFPFPSSHPPAKKWAYRTQGAFALPGFAMGAYATLLALRFLGPEHDAEMSWYPGGEVGPENDKYELDFVAFRRRRFGRGQVSVLMGECKTFDEFKAKEVGRFRDLAKRFPGIVRVFATLRSELTAPERKAIATLAIEGRKFSGSRSPVLVLTGIELLADSRPPHCYEDAGGRFAQFKNANLAPMMGDDELLGLCHLTQQIHLGTEPYWDTVDREIARRRQRARRSVAPPATGPTA